LECGYGVAFHDEREPRLRLSLALLVRRGSASPLRGGALRPGPCGELPPGGRLTARRPPRGRRLRRQRRFGRRWSGRLRERVGVARRRGEDLVPPRGWAGQSFVAPVAGGVALPVLFGPAPDRAAGGAVDAAHGVAQWKRTRSPPQPRSKPKRSGIARGRRQREPGRSWVGERGRLVEEAAELLADLGVDAEGGVGLSVPDQRACKISAHQALDVGARVPTSCASAVLLSRHRGSAR
jgi:hypothetical protein